MQLRNLVGLVLLASILAGCNLPAQPPATQINNQEAIATVVAQTMQAAQTHSVSAASEIASTSPSTTASPIASPGTVTPTGTTTATPTATSPGDKPILSITANSNCRAGPGASFKNVTSFTPGTKLDILAYDSGNNYWQVKIPNSGETCWVWGQYATASGNVANLPTASPATAMPVSLPNRPGALHYTYECAGSTVTVTFNWNDSADNETGYRVYRFDKVIADLPANSTSYTDTYAMTPGSTLQYSVTAYNDAGESAKRTQEFAAC